MRNYPVLITEMLQKYVNVSADSATEAVERARKVWNAGAVVLDADNFTGVEISTVEDENIVTLHRDCNGNGHLEKKPINAPHTSSQPIYTVSVRPRMEEEADVCTACFTTREKAESFAAEVRSRFGDRHPLQICIDSDVPDSNTYLDFLKNLFESEGEIACPPIA